MRFSWRNGRNPGDRPQACDSAAAGFKRVTPKVTGRPGYAPGDLLKLYIYGYLNRVRSSRRLEAECHRNIEVILSMITQTGPLIFAQKGPR